MDQHFACRMLYNKMKAEHRSFSCTPIRIQVAGAFKGTGRKQFRLETVVDGIIEDQGWFPADCAWHAKANLLDELIEKLAEYQQTNEYASEFDRWLKVQGIGLREFKGMSEADRLALAQKFQNETK